jgi:hypothetical protein
MTAGQKSQGSTLFVDECFLGRAIDFKEFI